MCSALKIFAAILVAPLWLLGQDPHSVQNDSPLRNLAHDISVLQLDSSRRTELESAIEQRAYKKAESILVTEAERDPHSIRGARLLEFAGGVFFLDGQYLNSAIAWKKAEAIASLDERNSFTLAMAYIKLGRRDWAQQQLEKLSADHPANSLYEYWLARFDYDSQKYSSAITRLKRIIAVDPDMMRAYDLLGLCYDYSGNLEQALENYKHAIELNRKQPKPSPWPNVDLAIALITANRLDDAEANLREAAGYDPKLAQPRYQLGRVLEIRGQYKSAIQELTEAVALDPNYPEPHYLLGRAYQRLGESSLAKSEISRFEELKKSQQAPQGKPAIAAHAQQSE